MPLDDRDAPKPEHERDLAALNAQLSALREQIDLLRAENAALQADAKKSRELTASLGGIPPGHFHSPYPSLEDVRRASRYWTKPPRELEGLELRAADQLELLEQLSSYNDDLTFPTEPEPGSRYWVSDYFNLADAAVLHSMIRHLRPQRIVEVGSGFSSAVMLDTNDRFFDGAIECTFIEPNPDRLQSLLRPTDLQRHRLLEQFVQDVPLSKFEALQASDILFIDSSHVSKAGSDVNHLLLDVLPRLREGVHVHLHDVFYPFEYRRDWLVNDHRAWNESYLLRAFMTYNSEFQIRFFSNYLKLFHREAVERALPSLLKQGAGSIWLRRGGSGNLSDAGNQLREGEHRPQTDPGGAVLDASEEWRLIDAIQQLARDALPREAGVAVVVLAHAELLELGRRKTWRFPTVEDPVARSRLDLTALVRQLEGLRSEGAEYLLVPWSAAPWLRRRRRFKRYLEEHHEVIKREDGICLIYTLRQEGMP